ncbi:tRNA (guanosine(37)-N1)-methyltransferase TrmD [Candidatus Uhrbacteria bacterium]|nr:tRNA (guanosine(37)-N1)-methyltransferase TrmD [Candidatus Uhrbacteria bacterium]
MVFDIITIFPELFPPYLNESLLKHAQKKGLLDFRVHNLRDYAPGKHHVVDDRPYGGGPGMILRADIMIRCLETVTGYGLRVTKKTSPHSSLVTRNSRTRTRVIALDPAGKQLTQAMAKRLTTYDQLVLLCGRYEGFDERVYKFADEKISIGPYVLLGGELPALVVIDAVSRMIPGVVGDPESIVNETHSTEGYVEYPQYTRPEAIRVQGMGYRGKKKLNPRTLTVPNVLLSGDHKKIEQWRKKYARHK